MVTNNERRNSSVSAAGTIGPPRSPGNDDPAARLGHLLPALRWLDRLLAQAVASVPFGAEAEGDPYRGLCLQQDEVERLLTHEPAAPAFLEAGFVPVEPAGIAADDHSPLLALGRAFGLSTFDLDVVLIALAPEIDLRYERLFAYLQDDVARRRPSVDLTLNLLCGTAAEKLARRAHFAPDAPLVGQRLVHLVADPHQPQPPLLAQYLKLDEQTVRLLLGEDGLDSRLTPFCQLVEQGGAMRELPLGDEPKEALWALTHQARAAGRPLRVYFHGPPGSAKRATAESLAGEPGAPLLVADLGRALAAPVDWDELLLVLFREAVIRDAILYLPGMDALRAEDRSLPCQRFFATLGEHAGIVILGGTQPWVPPPTPAGCGPLGVMTVPFPALTVAMRQVYWQAHLRSAGLDLSDDDLDALASRFRLTPEQIAESVAAARNQALRREAGSMDHAARRPGGAATVPELFAAARAQTGHGLATLARKIEPHYTWDDIVLPPDATALLRGVVGSIKHRHIVYDQWGFDRKLSLGKGLNVLFGGPSGTGKTMAAEVIAHDLALDLYKIDLSQVVSKYIGETEKNLDRVFREAQSSNAILFFDEADALFGKRSEVKDAHDRYANIETGYLLQKMEEYEGVAILATNLPANLDDAFARRMHFTVEFPFPDEEHRYRIWRGIFPQEAALGEDFDAAALARTLKLSGGNIRNIALAAAFMAAEDGQAIGMSHLMRAARREFQKVGRAWEGGSGVG
jgi:AAA+ superfamily predicted ATPase